MIALHHEARRILRMGLVLSLLTCTLIWLMKNR